jgi:hypothetical protein
MMGTILPRDPKDSKEMVKHAKSKAENELG